MKKLKVFFLWLYKFGLTGLLIVFLCFAPFSILPNILRAQGDVNAGKTFEYQGILELWHVETFEGGSVSRLSFLQREASIFEKAHKGTYISLQTMSLEQFNLNLSAGKKPNLLSFGIGVGSNFLKDLIFLDSENVRDDISLGGIFNGKQFAVPYILGGYCLISNSDANNDNEKTEKQKTNIGKTGVGLLGSINPLKAVEFNNKKIVKIFDDMIDKNMDTYTAYDKFIKGNFSTLVGTQRDVYRCFNKIQNGSMANLNFDFLGGWTDLVQYMSVFSATQIEEQMCRKFVSQLIGVETQKKLANYNLFSVLKNSALFETGIYKDFENVLNQKLKVENVFLNLEQIESQKQTSYKNVVLQ